MESFATLIKNRRSARHFTDEKINPQDVEQIMKAALMSPTSKNSRSWQFILIEDKEVLKALSESKSSGAAFLANCALAVVVLSDPLSSEASVQDISIAATYIQLQAEDLGLGSCWCQIAGRETPDGQDSEQFVRNLLDIPFSFGIGCIIGIGHKARTGNPHNEEKLLWEKVHLGKFSAKPIE